MSELTFMPHGHCYFWDPFVLWLNVLSDVVIGIAYFSIPLALIQVIRRREDLVFHWMFVLFAIFILACGATHLIEVWNVWHGHYIFAGVVKLITAIASITTAFLLWPLIPKIVNIPSNSQLAELNKKLLAEIHDREHAQSQIVALNESLEFRVVEATREFRQLADSMPQIIWAARPDGTLDYFNRRWYDFTGTEIGRSQEESWQSILYADDLRRCTDRWRSSVETGNPYEVECRLKDRRHDEYRWFIGRALPIADAAGKIVRWYGTWTDINAQKRLEEERTVALAQERVVRSTLEESSRIKDEFLATLSHELRTPLNAILGWVQLIRRGKMDGEKLAQALDTVERNARSQVQIIEDLLDMNRIVSGKVRLDVHRLHLPQVIESAIETLLPTAEAKEIRIDKLVDPVVGEISGDAGRLQQIIWNLISNAIKFTEKGGLVTISAKVVSSHVELSVTDTGRGIDPDFLPFVFEKFRQADSSTTRRFGGLGIGLSIVKSLTELHGGTVRALSAGEGHGATFSVTIPINAKYRSEPLHSRTRSQPPEWDVKLETEILKGRRIVAVDDQADARELVKAALEEYGAEVITAESVDVALAIISESPPDAVVSDIGMPSKDGFQFIKELRAQSPEQGGGVPAVALTAFARSEDRVHALQVGYQMYISKPVDPNELVAAVASLVDRAKSR